MIFRAGNRLLPVPGVPGAKTMPSLPRLAINATRAAVRNTLGLLRGHPVKVEARVAYQRREICHQCEPYFDTASERCSHRSCGCYLGLKRWLWAEHCPAGKW